MISATIAAEETTLDALILGAAFLEGLGSGYQLGHIDPLNDPNVRPVEYGYCPPQGFDD